MNKSIHSFKKSTADMTLAERESAVLAAEMALMEKEDSAWGRLEHSERTHAQLLEANERLVVATVQAQAMTEAAEAAAAKMSHMARHDVLTGLPNRSLLTDRLAQAISLAPRRGKRVALMYLDLDHFKHINDSLGHTVGDQLLQSVALRLQACVRNSDTVCRQGGDEFVVLLAEVDGQGDAALSAEKLIEAMVAPHLIGEHRLNISLSIGISLYPDDGQDVETIVKNADLAMYHAKRHGRNNYQMFAPEMNVRAVARQSVEVAMRQALDQHEFLLHYQPKFNLETGAITGAEALVRMHPKHHSMSYPAEFVNIAEDCGLIVPIGKWVLREACEQVSEWLKTGAKFGQIGVNVSAIEFHGKYFLSEVQAIIDDTGLNPSHLEFELTESGLMQDTKRTMSVLRSLKDLGIQIAIDDFGTGYSSLSYLRRFPIDTLKIDQSFVQDIHSDAQESALVSTIIAMGKSLNLKVVAEGIETQQQLSSLHTLHCAEGQGYFLAHPMDAPAFTQYLANA